MTELHKPKRKIKYVFKFSSSGEVAVKAFNSDDDKNQTDKKRRRSRLFRRSRRRDTGKSTTETIVYETPVPVVDSFEEHTDQPVIHNELDADITIYGTYQQGDAVVQHLDGVPLCTENEVEEDEGDEFGYGENINFGCLVDENDNEDCGLSINLSDSSLEIDRD